MKRYKLLKDLPLVKAGTILEEKNGLIMYYTPEGDNLGVMSYSELRMLRESGRFDEWFEEVGNKSWKPIGGERGYLANLCGDKNALEKLKALKRLRNDGLRFNNWYRQDEFWAGTNLTRLHIDAFIDGEAAHDRRIMKDLDLLFEEEEEEEEE